MRFSASLGRTSIIVTVLVGFFFLAIIGIGYSFILEAGQPIPIYTGILFIAIYSIAYAYRVLEYELAGTELIIHRPIYNVHIQLSDIKQAERVEKSILL
jgi:hypothetical protein